MKPLLLTTCIALAFCASAQTEDFFLLKKRSGKTIERFYTGTFIQFISKDQKIVEGLIRRVRHDSVWIAHQQIARGFTAIGSVLTDTITYEARRFAVSDIYAIRKTGNRFSEASLAGLMMLGSAGYAGLHIINSLINKETINGSNLIAASVIFLGGVLINQLHRDYYYIGRKYRILYIPAAVK
ncbi:MAG TPA: hypothetical protein VF145_04930 [Chitinophagaceae bacterium]